MNEFESPQELIQKELVMVWREVVICFDHLQPLPLESQDIVSKSKDAIALPCSMQLLKVCSVADLDMTSEQNALTLQTMLALQGAYLDMQAKVGRC